MRPAALLTAGLLLLASPARAERLVPLSEAFRLAMKNHPTVKLLQERVRQAEAARYRTWTKVKPSAFMQQSLNIYDNEVIIPATQMGAPAGTPDLVFQKKFQWGSVIQLKLPLIVPPAYPAIQAAYKQVEVARLNAVRSSRDFLLQVARSYYAVVSQKEILRSLATKVELDRKHLAAARAKVEVGQAPRVAELRADLVLTQDQQKLLVARNAVQAARRQLGILLGVSGAVDVRRPHEPPTPAGSYQEQLHQAVQGREDIKAAQLNVEAAGKGRTAVWLSFLPTLDFSWNYRWTQAAGFVGDQDTWYFLFNLNLALYDGGARYASLRETASKLRMAREQVRAIKASIAGEIVQQRSDLTSAEAGLVSAEKALKLARTTREDIDASYAAGAATQLDVLDASQRQLEAEINLVSSKFQRDIARLSLAHALGTFAPEQKK